MKISLNCDLGEGLSNDALIMPYINVCNIACGGHYGNAKTIQQTIKLAQKHQVEIGAHPSYPDKKNFGRLSLDVSETDLIKTIQQQLKLFTKILEQQKATLHHIKAHGALYNDIVKDEQKAKIYLKALEKYKENCLLFVPPNSIILQMARQQGFKICAEAFADRTYNDDLSLVSRKLPGAIIQQSKKALQQVLLIIERAKVISITGKKITINADTFCVHSDTENALQIVQHLYQYFNVKDTGIG